MGDLVSFIGLSLTAMLNPTLLAAVTVMMLLPDPKRLMLGYLLGSYLTSISVGLLIAFSLHGSGSVESARTTFTPAEGAALLAATGGEWLPEDQRQDLVRAVDGHALATGVLAGLLADHLPAEGRTEIAIRVDATGSVSAD